MKNLFVFPILCAIAAPALADKPVIESVVVEPGGGGWTFHVTVSHADTGWEHYADGWGVYTEGGQELGYRVLHHPHVNEQPFTRSLSNVVVPGGVRSVVIIPRDSKHGTGAPFPVALPLSAAQVEGSEGVEGDTDPENLDHDGTRVGSEIEGKQD